MICEKCKAIIDDNCQFCTHCGKKVEKVVNSMPQDNQNIINEKAIRPNYLKIYFVNIILFIISILLVVLPFSNCLSKELILSSGIRHSSYGIVSIFAHLSSGIIFNVYNIILLIGGIFLTLLICGGLGLFGISLFNIILKKELKFNNPFVPSYVSILFILVAILGFLSPSTISIVVLSIILFLTNYFFEEEYTKNKFVFINIILLVLFIISFCLILFSQFSIYYNGIIDTYSGIIWAIKLIEQGVDYTLIVPTFIFYAISIITAIYLFFSIFGLKHINLINGIVFFCLGLSTMLFMILANSTILSFNNAGELYLQLELIAPTILCLFCGVLCIVKEIVIKKKNSTI